MADTKTSCDRAIRACFTLTVLAMIVVQGRTCACPFSCEPYWYILAAVLVLRIWYLFTHSKIARVLVTTSFFASALTQSLTLGLSFKDLHSEIIVVPGVPILRLGCMVPPMNLWRLFVSPMVLHTVLYLFIVYRAVRSHNIAAETTPLMRRLLREYVVTHLHYCQLLTGMILAVGYCTLWYSVRCKA